LNQPWEHREDTKGTWFHIKKIFFTWLILREKYYFTDTFSALSTTKDVTRGNSKENPQDKSGATQ